MDRITIAFIFALMLSVTSVIGSAAAKNWNTGSSTEQNTQQNSTIKLIEVPVLTEKLYAYDSSTTIGKVLSNRRTINPFLAWNNDYGLNGKQKGYGDNGEYYGLFWNNGSGRGGSAWSRCHQPNRLELKTPSWNYHYVGKDWDLWSNIKLREAQKTFLTKIVWGHRSEFNKAFALNVTHPNFAETFAEEVSIITLGCFHGVMLDWWHNEHPTPFRGGKLDIAMQGITTAIRKKMGDDFLILGNVNYRKNSKIIGELNGVFLELYKKTQDPYSNKEIEKIEGIIDFYNEKLKPPRIIAFEPWRVSDKRISKDFNKPEVLKLVNRDRNSEENRQYARLYTAMSAVAADTGYILYPDNGVDTAHSEHDHFYYDVWRIDLGQPNTKMTELTKGVRIKGFVKGFIAYNRTKKDVLLQFKDYKVLLKAEDAIFVDKNGKSVL